MKTIFRFILYLLSLAPAFAQSPGGVSANLRIWLKADDGFSPASWQDRSGAGNTYTQTNVGKQPVAVPASTTYNFNPSVDFGGETAASAKFMVVPSGRPFTATGSNGSFFIITKFNSDLGGGFTPILLGLGATTTGADPTFTPAYYPALCTFNDNATYNHMTWVYDTYSGNFGAPAKSAADNIDGQVNLDDYSWTVGGTYFSGTNGNSVSQGPLATSDALYIRGNLGSIIGQNGIRTPNANIPEVIGFERDLSTAEKQKVNTYLAVKYGITLSHDYIAPSGALLYSISDVFKFRITGIGKDIAENLLQKQSRSVHSGNELTMGLQNQIAATNAAHTGSFLTDASYDLFGDNNLTGTNNLFPSNQCYTETNITNFTNRVWKLTESGTVDSVKITLPNTSPHIATFLASGAPIFLVAGNAADFGGTVKYIPGKLVAGNWEFKYDFAAASTGYFKFAGTVTEGTCISCEGGPQFSSPGLAYSSPLYGNSVRTQTATGGTADIVVNYELKDPHNAVYYPTYWPLPYADWAYAYRYDNLSGPNSDITWEMNFSKAAKPSFQIAGIDALYANVDEVTVVGYCGAQLILPRLSPGVGDNTYFTGSQYNSYTLNANTATGRYYYMPNSPYGFTNVEFSKPVDRVQVIWKKATSTATPYFQELAIGKVTLNCQKPLDAICASADEVYIDRSYDAITVASCDTVTLAFKITNKSCFNKTITLTDNIPGLAFVNGSVNPLGISFGAINQYDGSGSLVITDALITPGEHTIYAKVYSPDNATTTYTHQSSFTVQGGGTGMSDDLSPNPGCQANVITFNASAPTFLPAITKTVDKAIYDAVSGNDVITYTVNFENTSGGPITNATLIDFAGGQAHFVPGSLSSPLGGTANSYGSPGKETGLFIVGMNIPVGSSSITYQVNSTTSSDTIKSVVTLQGDPTNRCAGATSVQSNEVLSLPGGGVPDLTPIIVFDNTVFSANQSRDFILNIEELEGVATTSAVVIRINRLSGWDISVPGLTLSGSDQSGVFNTSSVAGGTPNENGNWLFRQNANFITMTLKAGNIIAANGKVVIGLKATRKSGTAPGSAQNLAPTIISGSGGDINDINNKSVTQITTN